MSAVTISIGKLETCPDIALTDTSVFPGISETELQSDFNQFAKIYLTQPNGAILPLNSFTAYNGIIINTPDNNLDSEIPTCMVGLFSVKYIALPTPRESMSQDSVWESGDCFYYNGKIYKAIYPITLPDILISNDDVIAAGIQEGILFEITEDQISSNYISELEFTHFCNLISCLRKKLRKINCLIVKEPTRRDICEMKLYEEILVLFAYNTTVSLAAYENVVPSPVTPSEVDYYKIMSNFVNSVCCCEGCMEDCDDCGGDKESDELASPNMTVAQDDLPEDFLASLLCVESKLKTSFCNGCKCCDICKNPQAVDVIKATLLVAELQLYGGDKTSSEYLDMLSQYTTTIKILCQC